MKKDFQDGHHGGHLGFLISRILAIFDLQVTLMLPTKFGVNWPFGSGDEVKNRFQDGRHGGHLGFTIGTNLAIFDLQVTPMPPTKFQVNWPFGAGEDFQEKIDFQDGSHGGHPGFPIGTILGEEAIYDLQITLMLPTKFRVN